MTNTKEISFTYTNDTIGMPDHAFIDPLNNRPAEFILRNALCMRDRRQGKMALSRLKKNASNKIISITEGKEPLIDYYADPTFRRMLYFSACEKYLKKLKQSNKVNLSRVVMPSWELITFFEYAPELFTDNTVFEGFRFPVDTDLLDKKNDTDEVDQESLMLASAIARKLLDELQTIDDITKDRKKLLSDAVLACATVVSSDIFNKATALIPELLEMYTSLCSLEYNQLLAATSKEDQLKIGSTRFDNEENFLDAIEAKLAECRVKLGNTARVHELSSLVDDYVNWLDAHPKTSVEKLFSTWSKSLFSMGKRAKLPLYTTDGEESVIWDIFQQVWVEHFKSEVNNNSIDNTLVEQFEKIKKAIQELLASITEIESQLSISQNELNAMKSSPANSVLAQRKKDRALLNLEMAVSSRRSELLDVQDKAALSLLPFDSSLDIFDQESMGNGYEVDMGFASEDLSRALQEFAHWAAEYEPDSELELGDRDNGDIALPTSPPISGEPDAENAPATEGPTADNTELENEGMDGISNEVEIVPSSRGELETEESEGEVEASGSIKAGQTLSDEIDGSTSDISGVESESKVAKEHLDWCELALACKAELDRDVFISGKLVNEALATFVLNGQVEMASDFSFTLSDSQLSSDHLPYTLFKAVYYGMNTWNDRACFNKARRLLNEISTGDLDCWAEQHHADIVPYLLFSACFQPAIFGGNASIATTLLRDIPDMVFDQNTRSLITETIELADRGEFVTLKSLKASGKTDGEVQKFDLTGLDRWTQKIRQSRRGYAPVLKAQKFCLENGIFNVVETILRANEKQKISEITQFVAQYDGIEASTVLLNEILDQINFGSEIITRVGLQRFHSKVSDLVDIARDWMVSIQPNQGSHTEQYCTRFSTRLQKSIDFFESVAKEKSIHLPRRAGAQLVAKQLNRLQKAISAGGSGWAYSRTKGWYYHPQMLMRIDGVAEEPVVHLNWHLSQLGKPLVIRSTLNKAIDAQYIQLAELLRLNLIDSGVQDVPDIQGHFLTLRSDLISRCRQLDGQLENALLAGLIDAAKAEKDGVELIEMQETLEHLTSIESVDEIKAALDDLESTLRDLTANTKQNLAQRYEDLLAQVLSRSGEGAVPESWRGNMQDALRADNLPVVGELIDELERAADEGESIKITEVKNVPVLQEFVQLEDDILQGIRGVKKRSDLWSNVTDGGGAYGLTFNGSPKGLRQTIETLEGWKTSGKPPSISQETYNKVVNLLEQMGIYSSDITYKGIMKPALNYQTGIGFSSMLMKIRHSASTRPFTLFGSSRVHPLSVIVAYSSWTPEQLKDVMDSHHIHDEAVFISCVPMTHKQRYDFSVFSKKFRKTLLHFDLSIALFLASQQKNGAENIAIRNFLWLTAPYTYFNPYSGTDASKPPLREMRYGRELQIDSLQKMNNGSAIVFGGRQLGKSTIMQEVRARFNRPSIRQYASYEMLDRDMFGRTAVSRDDLKKAETRIWRHLYSWLQNINLIKNPQHGHDINVTKDAVKQAFINNKDSRFIMIFDEIDPILHVDSAHDFSIFRGIRNLVQDPEIYGRLKVIIGGLANVKRFEDFPNYPLTQLGGSIQVSIMPAQEAIHLITEPLRAAGYTFDNDLVVNRILATTNRHPGLIQIFCYELINHLSNNKRQEMGSCIIFNEDVDTVSRKKTVMGLIRDRFDMTLNLDKRYQVIIYSIINDGRGSQVFSPRYAKELSECWLPSAFSHLSDSQFEVFLVELVGLGVLRPTDGIYAIRNTNILKLLTDGHGDDAATKLERAIKDYISFDPLDRHSYNPNKHSAPMPITCRDEKALLGVVEYSNDASPLRKSIVRQVTTTIMVGSEALGLGQVEGTLPSLLSEEYNYQGEFYSTHGISTDQYPDPATFSRKVLNPLVTKCAKEGAQMIFITIGQNTSLACLLGMLDSAHLLTEENEKLKSPLRIVFLMGTASYWQWLCHPDLTRSRESLQPFIKLGPWATDAIRTLLERLGMIDSDNATEEVCKMTDGWYFSLEILARVSHAHPDWKHLSQFSRKFTALTELPRAGAEKFLRKTGLLDHTEALSILEELYKEYGTNPFSHELIELYAEEIGAAELGSDKAIAFRNWLIDTNLLSHVRGKDATEKLFCLRPAISHALDLCTADE